MKAEKIINIKINKIKVNEVLEEIKGFLLSEDQHYIVTLNPEMVVEAQDNIKFKDVVNKADLVIADGIGILWALEFLKKNKLFSFRGYGDTDEGQFEKENEVFVIPAEAGIQDLTKEVNFKHKILLNAFLIKPLFLLYVVCNFFYTLLNLLFNFNYRKKILKFRIHGIDLIYKMFESESIRKKRVYFLGAGEGVAKEAIINLKKRYPYAEIVGAEEGIKKNQDLEIANHGLIQRINEIKPDILLVAFGAPKQEIWISENLKKIPSVKLAIGVGGSFDFISGRIKRAPTVFQITGLEWLWRLLLEPKRIKRIYNATIKFSFLVLIYKIKNAYKL